MRPIALVRGALNASIDVDPCTAFDHVSQLCLHVAHIVGVRMELCERAPTAPCSHAERSP
jgi:hypothetical protein